MLVLLIKIWSLFNIFIFTLLGIFSCFFYEKLLSHLKLAALSPSAVAEIKASYGGLLISLGAFMLILYVKQNWHMLLLLITIIYFGYALGRTIGILMNNSNEAQTFLYLAFEIICLILSFTLFRYFIKAL